MSVADDHVAQLVHAVRKHADAHQGKYLELVSSEAALLLAWTAYLRIAPKNKDAVRLLDAVQGGIIEVAGCLSLGLVRPAIFSLRTQLELMLAWIYFNDHAIEFSQIEKRNVDFPLRSKFKNYFSEYGGRYSKRVELLLACRNRTEADPYSILSNHVHSHSPYAAPKIVPLDQLVKSDARCTERAKMQGEVAEYLTDTLASWYADDWHAWPTDIQSSITARLAGKKLKEFCKTSDGSPTS